MRGASWNLGWEDLEAIFRDTGQMRRRKWGESRCRCSCGSGWEGFVDTSGRWLAMGVFVLLFAFWCIKRGFGIHGMALTGSGRLR